MAATWSDVISCNTEKQSQVEAKASNNPVLSNFFVTVCPSLASGADFIWPSQVKISSNPQKRQGKASTLAPLPYLQSPICHPLSLKLPAIPLLADGCFHIHTKLFWESVTSVFSYRVGFPFLSLNPLSLSFLILGISGSYLRLSFAYDP